MARGMRNVWNSTFRFRKVSMMVALVLGVLLSTFAAVPLAGAQGASHLRKPALIVSAGQSTDALMVNVLLNKKLGMGLGYKQMATVDDLKGIKTLVVVVGVSSKGLGAAGLDVKQETERVQALLDAAQKDGIAVLLMHTGGQARRGAQSNQVIELVARHAASMVVVKAGNKDGFFNNLASQHRIPLIEVDTINDAGPAVKELFAE